MEDWPEVHFELPTKSTFDESTSDEVAWGLSEGNELLKRFGSDWLKRFRTACKKGCGAACVRSACEPHFEERRSKSTTVRAKLAVQKRF